MRFLPFALFATSGAFGGTIVSDLFGGGSATAVNGVFAVSWTQSAAYTDVTIGANVLAPGITTTSTGTAYLVDQIGPGTTIADELAPPAPISVNGDPGINTMTTLFTGLTLGPGTYYLVIVPSSLGQSDSLKLQIVAPPQQTLGAGVTQNQSQQALSPSGFGPANTFANTTTNPIFSVTGTVATPEPSSILLGLTGIGAVGFLRWRRKV